MMVLPMTDKEKLEREFYLLFHAHRGSFSGVSGYLQRDDSTKISRQLNPGDDRYSNPFFETLEVLWALKNFAPNLEKTVWDILVREREGWSTDCSGFSTAADLLKNILDEFTDLIYADKCRVPDEQLEKELFELKTAVEEKLNFVKNRRGQTLGVEEKKYEKQE
jgi:hypothetical protein